MSSLSPFTSNDHRGLAPSNIQVVIDLLAAATDEQFQEMASRVQWDEVVTAPQCMQIDGEVQVVNKQVLSPLQYAIWSLPAQRLEWLLPRALANTRPQSRYFRHDEGLIHENDPVFSLLPVAIATGDKKKVDAVFDQISIHDNNRLFRMSHDSPAPAVTETVTPDDNLANIPGVIAHMGRRLTQRAMADQMFSAYPHDARRLIAGIRKNFMCAFAARARAKVLEVAYPAGRKVPLKVWDEALSRGGMVSWCTDKISDIAPPTPAERRASNDRTTKADACPVMLVVHAIYQATAASEADFVTPEQRHLQRQWTLRAIDVMAAEWIHNGVPLKARTSLWEKIGEMHPQVQDALAKRLDEIQLAHPDGFYQDWNREDGEVAAWVRAGRFDIAANRANTFPGVVEPGCAMRMASILCANWCASQSDQAARKKGWAAASLPQQASLHDAWGITTTAVDLLKAGDFGSAPPNVMATFDQFMLEHRTPAQRASATPSPAPKRI